MAKDTNYYELVYEITKQIPKGKATSYGAIADFLNLGSARMVGWALNQLNGHEGDVPAHRVVNRKGELSGRHHWNPPSRMAELLETEGIKVKNDCIVDFEKVFWSPSELDY